MTVFVSSEQIASMEHFAAIWIDSASVSIVSLVYTFQLASKFNSRHGRRTGGGGVRGRTVQLMSREVLGASVRLIAVGMVANVALVSVATRSRPSLSAAARSGSATAIAAAVAAAVSAEL